MKPNDIVTDLYRVTGTDPFTGSKAQRKVYRVLGPSRAVGKVRIETWSQASATWSRPYTVKIDCEPEYVLVPAPVEWEQTRAARRSLQTNGSVRRRRL